MARDEKKAGMIRSGFKMMVNVPRWMAWDQLLAGGRMITSTFKAMTRRRSDEGMQETYEEAVARLGLDEKALQGRQKAFFRLAMLYLFFALCLFVYTIYIFVTGHYFTSFLCLCLTVLMLTYALREHFWYIQIKNHKFGCTFKDWWQLTLAGLKK